MKKAFLEKNIFGTKLREVNSVKGRNKLLYNIIQIRSSQQRCSVRIGVLRNFTNSEENTFARVSFLIKLQASGPQLYSKRNSGTDVFL